MPKLLDYQNPISGKTDSITNIGGLWSMILGVFVLFLVVAMGQNLSKAVSRRVPAIDTQIDKLTSNPVVVQVSQKRVI